MINTASQIQLYLSDQLQSLQKPANINLGSQDLSSFIYQALTTTKYRRHSISPEYQDHIKKVIATSISKNQPIPLVWVFGCYKLWRLPESPYVDWAELFFLIHKVSWLKPILAAYKPGIWFDFFADGIVVPLLNHIPESDMTIYQDSFRNLLSTFKKYIPHNLIFTLHTLEELYGSKKEFQKEFKINYDAVIKQDKTDPYIVSDQQKSVINMNVKSDKELSENELHQSQLIFEAFVLSSKRRPYYRTPDKIFLDSFPIKNCLPIGATRTSSVRFWISKGVLEKRQNSFIETVLSFKQIQKSQFSNYPIDLPDFNNPNYKSISILK
jgi:hypothetical protein